MTCRGEQCGGGGWQRCGQLTVLEVVEEVGDARLQLLDGGWYEKGGRGGWNGGERAGGAALECRKWLRMVQMTNACTGP